MHIQNVQWINKKKKRKQIKINRIIYLLLCNIRHSVGIFFIIKLQQINNSNITILDCIKYYATSNTLNQYTPKSCVPGALFSIIIIFLTIPLQMARLVTQIACFRILRTIPGNVTGPLTIVACVIINTI